MFAASKLATVREMFVRALKIRGTGRMYGNRPLPNNAFNGTGAENNCRPDPVSRICKVAFGIGILLSVCAAPAISAAIDSFTSLKSLSA